MKNIALVMCAFHKERVERMLDEARKTASDSGLIIVDEVWVPGSVEMPLVVKKLLLRDDVNGVALLGIIEKGGTKHGFVMGQALMNVVMQLQMEFMKPVCLGVLGPDIDDDQIEPRLLSYAKKAIKALESMLSL